MSDDFIGFDQPEAGPSKSAVKKERKERVNTTVFVSSLPYNATSTDLLTHFSFLGPVRHGFITTDKETGKSKGVGYVTYSLKEDAEKAVGELNGGEFGDKGRKIRVSWAEERPHYADRYDRPAKADGPAKKPRTRAAVEKAPVDSNAIRTLVLSGLPNGLTKALLWKKVRKVDEGAELIFPVEGEPNTAHLVCASHSAALQALPRLHAHTYKESILSCVLKKRLDKLGTVGESKTPNHAGRLIVRNLDWRTTEQDLRSGFLPFGPIHSIDLPTLPSKLPTSADPSKKPPLPRARGFAFVWFLTRQNAETAMEALNGQMLKTSAGLKSGEQGRAIAVDWALSKDKWQETQKGHDEQKAQLPGKADNKVKKESSDTSASDSETSSSGEEDEENSAEYSLNKEAGDQKAGVDSDDPDEEEVKPTLPAVDVGSTLFVRNLPFETTEQELNTLFRSFGPLRYARITMDKETGRSRGSGFACFWKVEHADKAIEEAEKLAQETGANSIPLGTKNPFALPSVLTADPSSSAASRLVIHGRTLDVSRAVTRELAGQMKEDGERVRNAGDKRNTYLMREGVIFPNSPAAAGLPEAEVEKRQASFNARKTLLRSNPSLYISKTRLSIRQLPLFVTDRTLKRLAIHAVRAFEEEVTKGDREGLIRAEETDSTLSPAIAARKDAATSKGKKRGERDTAVIQSKVVRQTEKIDPLTGAGRSKGYGFLEMRSHREALKVLRWANNHPAAGTLMSEWWKEEMGDILERTKQALKDVQGGKVGKDSVEDLEGRVKKLESRQAEGDDRSGGMRGGKTLMIEFSIENVQVVKRRVEKTVASRTGVPEARSTGFKRKATDEENVEKRDRGAKKVRRNDKSHKLDGKPQSGHDRKGPRDGHDRKARPEIKLGGVDVQVAEAEPREKRGLEKLGSHLGSLIGRKRKQRRAG